MLPQVRFLCPTNIFVTGLGLRRPGADWQYYLPFKRVGAQLNADGTIPESHTKFALPLSETHVLVTTVSGELALIDLIADQVTVRAKIACRPEMIQVSEDHNHLFIQNSYSLFVLDTRTLNVIQYWFWIEQSGSGWVRNTVAESSSIERRKLDGGTLDRLSLSEPVRELDNGKLGARFRKVKLHKHEPESISGSYVFEIATGKIQRNEDEEFRDAGYRDAPPDDPTFAQKSPVYPPDGPAEFKAVVAREVMTTIRIANNSRYAALAALDDLAGQMERDLQAFVRCGNINLNFVLDDRTIEAGEFFDRFVQERWVEGVPTLRRLMLAYLNGISGGEGDMPWHEGGQSLLALRALVLLDADAHDVYRLYLDKGDLEHDHGPYELYAEYLDCHGVHNEEDVRFGIYLTVMGCLDTDTDPSALLKGAERHITPERFADILIEEAKRRRDDFWNDCGEEYANYLRTRCDTTFTHNVLQVLALRD